ncbi:hypothetical protein ACFPOD_05015 [Nitratireductor kimnyeongensis]|uniref:Uncharacterized protein n=1 Tax=Nitratireductor kimnyeongensis TaxID=430679 RepID=A0ABW0T4Z3_9HYPH|nr:hypothetical protein [Nitratireductor kimnyeongensis]QZZ34557.1 hypothetical protein KW403_12185 [Nitratireductor kimnyeongensis]
MSHDEIDSEVAEMLGHAPRATYQPRGFGLWVKGSHPPVAAQRAGMWTDYEPDYDAYIAETDSLEENMARVASYDDWFVEEE